MQLGRVEPLPWSRIIELSKSEFYAQSSPNYAQAWSMIYFLRTAPEVLERAEWAAILPTYFEQLKLGYARQFESTSEAQMSEKELGLAQMRAREAALREAFRLVDLDEIDRAWQGFVKRIVDPRED